MGDAERDALAEAEAMGHDCRLQSMRIHPTPLACSVLVFICSNTGLWVVGCVLFDGH